MAVNRPTPPSCHQKLGTVTNPRQPQSLGAIADQTIAALIMINSTGSQAPSARTAQTFFQFTPPSHQASQGIKSNQFQCSVTEMSFSNNPFGLSRLPKAKR